MAIIDDRGRLFGRLNLVDAAVGALVLILLPAAYGAYVLFKEPPATLTEVSPTRMQRGPNLTLYVHGHNFRPYMRVSFNDTQATGFFFGSATGAVIPVPDLPPGRYDIVLYDYMQEVSRMPKALTIDPPSPPISVTVELTGALTALSAEQVKAVQVGLRLPEKGPTEILAVGTPEPELMHIRIGDKTTLRIPGNGAPAMEVPVRLRTLCEVQMGTDGALRCNIRGLALAPDVNVLLDGFGQPLNFRVAEVHYPGRSRTATVHVRFATSIEVRGGMKVGDRDVGALAHPAGQMAALLSLVDRGDVSAATLRDDRIRQSIPTGRLLAVDAVLSVPVDDSPTGWLYKGAVVKVGAPISFETAGYTVDGGVTELSILPVSATTAVVPPK